MKNDKSDKLLTNTQKKEKTMWIIRYADGHMESHLGTYEEAEKKAEEHCILHLNDYIIA